MRGRKSAVSLPKGRLPGSFAQSVVEPQAEQETDDLVDRLAAELLHGPLLGDVGVPEFVVGDRGQRWGVLEVDRRVRRCFDLQILVVDDLAHESRRTRRDPLR